MQKKILYLIPRFTTGGAEQLVLAYTKQFIQQDYLVVVAGVVGGGEMEASFRALNVPILMGHGRDVVSLYKTKKMLESFASTFQPDIVHSHIFSGDVSGYFLKTNGPKNIHWVSTLHNVEHETPPLRRTVWRHILQKADQVIAVSQAVEDYATHEFAVPTTKLIRIDNGIDLSTWLGVPQDNLLKNPTVKLAIIGRVERQKGHDTLFSALEKIKDIPWTLTVFGEGSLVEELKARAVALGIGDRIAWAGVVENLPEKMKDIDIVVQPSRWEGRSLAVMEAMAAGRVVVASETAAEDLVRSGETGYVVPVGNVEGLVTALHDACTNNDQARAFAVVGRAFAKEHFSIAKHLAAVGEVYRQL